MTSIARDSARSEAARAYVNISSASLTNPASLTGINGSLNIASVYTC